MKFKRLTAVIAATVMVFSLAACGGDASGGQTGEQTAGTQQSEVKEESDAVQETAGGESVEIRFMWWGDTARNEIYNTICDRFELKNPGIKVVREPVSWNDMWTKMATQVAGGNAPDVFGMHPQYAADYALRGAMADLQPFVDQGVIDISKMPEAVVEGGKYDDNLYMIMQGVTFSCYLVNNELAQEYGVTLPAYNEDWTWAQFLEQADQFTGKAAGNGIYFAGDSSGDFNTFRWAAREAGGDYYSAEGKLGFEEKTLSDWFELWDGLRDAGSIPDAATATEDGTLALEQRLFTNGKMLIHNVPVNQLYLYQNAMPDTTVNAVRIPVGEDGSRAEYLEGAFFGIASASDEAHQLAAAKLINFFVNTEESMELFKMEQGVPANTDMAEFIKAYVDEPNKKALDFAIELMDLCQPADYAPLGASEIATAYKTYAEQISYGQTDDYASMAKQFMTEANTILDANK